MTSLQRFLLIITLIITTLVVWDYAQTVLGTTLVMVVGLTIIQIVRKRTLSRTETVNTLNEQAL